MHCELQNLFVHTNNIFLQNSIWASALTMFFTLSNKAVGSNFFFTKQRYLLTEFILLHTSPIEFSVYPVFCLFASVPAFLIHK